MQSPISIASMIRELINCYLLLGDIHITVLFNTVSVLQLWVYAWIAEIFFDTVMFWVGLYRVSDGGDDDDLLNYAVGLHYPYDDDD